MKRKGLSFLLNRKPKVGPRILSLSIEITCPPEEEEEEALGNGTHRKRGLEGSDSSSTSVTCFLCSTQPIISTRQFPYPQNEDIATYLTGHTTKSIRKESELPKAIWPVTGNFGKPQHIAKPPPEDCLGFQAFTRHLGNVSFLPRHRCCT